MMLKAFIIILWIGISNPSRQHAADFVVEFLKNPFNWTYTKENVGKNREDDEGVSKEDMYSEKMKARRRQAYKSHNRGPKEGFATSQVCPRPWQTSWRGT